MLLAIQCDFWLLYLFDKGWMMLWLAIAFILIFDRLASYEKRENTANTL